MKTLRGTDDKLVYFQSSSWIETTHSYLIEAPWSTAIEKLIAFPASYSLLCKSHKTPANSVDISSHAAILI